VHSAGVLPWLSSHRLKSFILTLCSTAGCFTRTFNSVNPSPISSTHMSPRRIPSACATASYSDSAVCHAGVAMRDPEIIETELMEIGAIADDTLKFERIIAWCASHPDEVPFALHQFMGRRDKHPSQTPET